MTEFINSKRVEILRKILIETKPEVCYERAEIVTEAYKKYINYPIALLRAKALEEILKEISIYILPGELIVGNHASKLKAAPVFPEFDVKYIKEELDQFEKRDGDPFLVTEEVKKKLLNIIPFWEGKTNKDYNIAMWTEENKLSGQGFVSVFDNEWALEGGDGHICVDYKKLINYGLGSIIDEAEENIQKLDLTDPLDLKKFYFYESVKIVLKAVINFAKRFSFLTKTLANKEKDQKRKKELEVISEICKNVPEKPAQNFYEALQSLWFVHLCIQIDTNGLAIAIGRFDQFMYPFYRKDIDLRLRTKKEIYELIQLFWLKLDSIVKLKSWGCTKFVAGHSGFQNLTIGGQTSDGDDACNELTFLCLDATESLRIHQPALTARIYKRSQEKFIRRCLELISLGITMPSFFNDDIIVPALINRGVNIEDAYNYCLVGCVEPTVPGKWGGRLGGHLFNIAKCLELALNNGKDPKSGIQLCPGDGDLSTFESFNEVLDAYKKQIKYYVRQVVIRDNIQDYIWEKYFPVPLISSLVSDCMIRGKEVKEGGAIYDYTGGATGSVASVGNILAAIKKLVFEEKKITGKDLKEVLDKNFEGIDGERVRQMLINRAPKYGNDDDYVDMITKEAVSFFFKEISKYKNTSVM